jgi:hypothetical protein
LGEGDGDAAIGEIFGETGAWGPSFLPSKLHWWLPSKLSGLKLGTDSTRTGETLFASRNEVEGRGFLFSFVVVRGQAAGRNAALFPVEQLEKEIDQEVHTKDARCEKYRKRHLQLTRWRLAPPAI